MKHQFNLPEEHTDKTDFHGFRMSVSSVLIRSIRVNLCAIPSSYSHFANSTSSRDSDSACFSSQRHIFVRQNPNSISDSRFSDLLIRYSLYPYLLLAMRLILAAVFIYAAVQKIGRPLQFADEIRMYHILDIGPPLYIVSIVLPWIELFCGISLITGCFLRGSALILVVFNVVFLIAVTVRTAQVMNEGSIKFLKVYFDCGCGFGETYAWKKLLEDFIFLVF